MSDLIPWMSPWSGRGVVLIVFCIGLFIAMRGLIRWRRTTPVCPRCGYDRSHSHSSNCPECGHVSRSADDLRCRPRRWRLVLIGALIALAIPAYVVQRRVKGYGWDYYTYVGPVYWIDPFKDGDSVAIQGVTIKTEHDRIPWQRRDRLVIIDADGRRVIGPVDPDDIEYQHWSLVNDDGHRMIGRWSRDDQIIAVLDYSGGAHCCFSYWLFAVRNGRAVHLTTLHTGNSPMKFEDVDGDGLDEVTLVDDTFAYWNTCFACSPMPKVIARWNGRALVLADELMRSPVNGEHLMRRAEEIAAGWNKNSLGDNGVPVIAWGQLLEVIYAGNADAGFELLTRTWRANGPDRTAFENEFLNQLARSPWSNDLARMNGGSFALRLQSERAAIAAAAEQR